MIRKTVKRWLYGSCPGFAGSFPYFGTKVYFPKGSYCFQAACSQGIFESDNVMILQVLAKPGATYFDVGANIGLMAAPILRHQPECHVVSFEASPSVLPYLRRTIEESPFHGHWKLVPNAVGAKPGRTTFSLSGEADSVYDGIQHTGRAAPVSKCEVEVTTLDDTWHQLGSPEVSHIKIDVEGGELDVLRGALECLRSERPVVLLEWNSQNFEVYGCQSRDLLDFANEFQMQLVSMRNLSPINSLALLELQMGLTENFLLLPEA